MERIRWEWLGCTAVVLAFLAMLEATGVLNRFDATVHDSLLQLRSRPVPEEIVIVAIDDTSLQALGAWPWPRELHASMLTNLAQAKPKGVAVNLLFLEPSNRPEADMALAQALQLPDLGAVVLPVTVQTPIVEGRELIWQKPTPVVADAVKRFGHINVELDEDGTARSMYVYVDNLQNKWPSLAFELLSESKKTIFDATKKAMSPSALKQRQAFLLPFSGASAHFKTVPFVNVLRGEVPSTVFKDKLVLVGVSAAGLGDQFVTPLSGKNGLTPGIHIAATALEGLIYDSLVTKIPLGTSLVISAFLILCWMLVLFPLGPKRSMIALLVALPLVVGIGIALLLFGQVWWSFSSLCVSVVLGYLLWSWRRVSVMFVDLKIHAKKLIALDELPEPSLVIDAHGSQNEWQDIVGKLSANLRTSQLRKLRVTDTLDALPEAVLLTDSAGNIEMANNRARALLKADRLEDKNALDLLYQAEINTFELSQDMCWRMFMSRIQATQAQGLEVMLAKGSYVLLRATAIRNLGLGTRTEPDDSWWIVMMVDVSKQNQLQRQRNDALQLLWHDLRAPLAAILTLLRTPEQASKQSQIGQDFLNEQISAQVNATLDLADSFVWQLRAESDTLECIEVDFIQLIHEVIDRSWPIANAKSISITHDFSQLKSDDDYKSLWLTIEPNLMRRALFNLVENAIKYSPPNTQVLISLRLMELNSENPVAKHQAVEIVVKDQGYGILESNLNKIFEPYTRFSAPKVNDVNVQSQEPVGYGLGLRLVKTVVDAHNGTISCNSILGVGSEFIIELKYQ